MPSLSSLQTEASRIARATEDPYVKKLADVVHDLIRETKKIEDEAKRAKHRADEAMNEARG